MDSIKRDFNKEAHHWDGNPGRVKLAGDVAEAILKAIIITSDMDALDYGCGTGLLTLLLQPHVRYITGMDSSQGMLDILNNKIHQFSLDNVTSKLFDLEKDNSLEGGYDLITCSMTLHHSEDPAYMIEKLCGGLRPGGYLCIADLDPDGGSFHGDNHGVFHFGFERSWIEALFIQTGLIDAQSMTAAEVTKKDSREIMQTFSIFLTTGKRPV